MNVNQTIIKNNAHFKSLIEDTIKNKTKDVYSYLNTYTLYLSDIQPNFQNYLQSANYIRVGGIGTKIYFKLLYKQNIDKVTFSHFFIRFGGNEFLSKKNYSVYCLGGSTIVANKLKETFLQEKINLIGFHHGYFSEKESNEIVHKINKLNPQILLIGLGTPLSDYWTYQNKEKLPNCAIIHVGNTFDLLTNQKKIGPSFLFNSGFEWAFRLLQEPKRLFKRYLKSNFHLFILIIQQLLKVGKK